MATVPRPAVLLTTNSFVRLISVGLRSLLTISMAVWLQPSELGLYAIVAATLTLTTYFYGLDFQTFSMRELSSADLAGARFRVRDQFTMLLLVYATGGVITAVFLRQFGLAPKLITVVVPMAILQHATQTRDRVRTQGLHTRTLDERLRDFAAGFAQTKTAAVTP